MFKVGDLVTPISKTVSSQRVNFKGLQERMKANGAECMKVIEVYGGNYVQIECGFSKADGTRIHGSLNFMFRDLIPFNNTETIIEYVARTSSK